MYKASPLSLHVSYQRLLQTISVLEAQRTQAILDLETLARHQKEALSDPIAFVDQLQKQVQKFPPGLPLLLSEMAVILSPVSWYVMLYIIFFVTGGNGFAPPPESGPAPGHCVGPIHLRPRRL